MPTGSSVSPLTLAAPEGHVELANLLMERGYTHLMVNDWGGLVEVLLCHGAKFDAQTEQIWKIAMSPACLRGLLDVARNLVRHGASIELGGRTPLEAVWTGEVEVVKQLLDAKGKEIIRIDRRRCSDTDASLFLLQRGFKQEKKLKSFQAVKRVRVLLAKLQIRADGNVDRVNDEGFTPLMVAAREGQVEMVKLLLFQGAKIDAQTEETQETALTLACCRGFLEVAECLIRRGASMELGRRTPLMVAAMEGHLEVVKHLLDAGAKIDAQTEETQETALTLACCRGFWEVAECLIGRGASMELGRRTPLMMVAMEGHLEVVKHLLDAGAEIDAQTEETQETALTLACCRGFLEVAECLIRRGASMELGCRTPLMEIAGEGHPEVIKRLPDAGFTPLMLAAASGHPEVVEMLLNYQANIEAQSTRCKDTALFLACKGGRYKVVEVLLQLGANMEHRNVVDYTPLCEAAWGGRVDIIKLLLRHGAEINPRTGSKLGTSPLMLASASGHIQAVKVLLEMGSDVNAQIEVCKNTALTQACMHGRHQVVSLLVDGRANIEHRSKNGLTPLMEAASGGYVEVGRVLLDKGAKVNASPVPSSGDTALTIAANKGHCKFVELLVQRGAKVDVKNKKGNSPLWLACNGGHLEVAQFLVNSNADMDSQDKHKVSCLMAACVKGHDKMVKWMVKKVSYFPSDQELQRFVNQFADKADLKTTCQSCMEIITHARLRRAEEADKNAAIMLQELDKEKEAEAQRKAPQAAKRKQRRQKKN